MAEFPADSLPESVAPPAVSQRDVVRNWWPLAASWLLMGLELPVVSAVMARLPDPTISLAAYGGVVFPLALLIESPIIMLLTASTALSRDEQAFRVISRFMWTVGLSLTALHAVVVFTPLYDVVAGRVLGVPEEIRGAARLGLALMLPWTMSIAFRRTHQGLLIRFGRSKRVGAGTAVRLTTNVLVLTAGAAYGKAPGIAVGTLAVGLSVLAEAIFAGFSTRDIRAYDLREEPVGDPPLDRARFLKFYVPLLLTPVIGFLAMPVTSAAMSRMPLALESLAVWPPLTGIVFTLRSVGFALSEVVIAMLDDPASLPALRRFTRTLAFVTSGLLAVLALTPLGHLHFARVAGLPPNLVEMAARALVLAVPAPALSAMQSLYQGRLVHAHRTRAITESVVVYMATTVAVLVLGIALGNSPGLTFGVLALSVALAAQTLWLARRAAQIVPV